MRPFTKTSRAIAAVAAAFWGLLSPLFAAETRTLTIIVHVPKDTPTVYVAGGGKELGNWKADGVALAGTGDTRQTSLTLEKGTTVEFKITLGAWEKEALLPDGSVPGNHKVTLDKDRTWETTVERFGERSIVWKDTLDEADIKGIMKRHLAFPSKYFSAPRNILVRLPADYETSAKRYGVLYMHDGQNLFDPKASFTGVDWGVDEALDKLSREGKIEDMIVVGIFNSPNRSFDYASEEGRGKYAHLLVDEVKPFIDKTYRTLPDPEHTGLMGSSYGGRISLYLAWAHGDVFGRVACLSNAIGHYGNDNDDLLSDIEKSAKFPRNVRLYFDYGSAEEDTYETTNARLAKDLESWGWKPDADFKLYVAPKAIHTERAWRERLDVPLLFLFGKK